MLPSPQKSIRRSMKRIAPLKEKNVSISRFCSVTKQYNSVPNCLGDIVLVSSTGLPKHSEYFLGHDFLPFTSSPLVTAGWPSHPSITSLCNPLTFPLCRSQLSPLNFLPHDVSCVVHVLYISWILSDFLSSFQVTLPNPSLPSIC